MGSQQLTERVRELRGRGCTPKQIARILGLPPATVAPVVRAIAAEQRTDESEPAPAGFWVSVPIMRTLRRSVGQDNFDFLVVA